MLHLNVYCMYKTRAMYTYNVCVCIFAHHTAVTRMAVSTTTMAAQTTPILVQQQPAQTAHWSPHEMWRSPLLTEVALYM